MEQKLKRGEITAQHAAATLVMRCSDQKTLATLSALHDDGTRPAATK